MNIVTVVSSLLTPAVVARIATALGINPTIAQMLVTTALPAILAGISSKATHPSGLGVLTGLLGQQNPAMLAHLGELIGSSNQTTLVNSGTETLHTLFGRQATGALAGALGTFTGVPQTAGADALGMLAPLAFGAIAKAQHDQAIDGTGLAAFLNAQNSNIAAAIPSGFADLLKSTGLVDGGLATTPSTPIAPRQPDAQGTIAAANAAMSAVTAAVTHAAIGAQRVASTTAATAPMAVTLPPTAVAEAAKPIAAAPVKTATAAVVAASAAVIPMTAKVPSSQTQPASKPRPVMDDAAVNTRPPNLLPWLAAFGAIAIAVLAWQLMSKRGPDTGAAIVVNSVDVGKRTASLYEGIKSSVAAIKDEATANASLPRLREQSAAILDVRDLVERMPAGDRKDIATLVAPMIPGLEALVTTAVKVPGAAGIVSPVLSQIIERMKALTKG